MKTKVWLVAGLFFPWIANAFSLNDHRFITERAVQEFNRCNSSQISNATLEALVQANQWEDLNLVRKWTQYSHYYRPMETLDLFFRQDASARVQDLNYSRTIEATGGVLHYLQDVSSPPHVIPVSHGLDDGFESYALSNPQILNEKLDCPSQERKDALSLLSATAFKTLSLLSELKMTGISADGQEYAFSGADFWQESSQDLETRTRPFGNYGSVGNEFGSPYLTVDRVTYHIQPEEYDRFKWILLQHAIRSSLQFLMESLK